MLHPIFAGMAGQRPFSKLKLRIEALFAPELDMRVDCTAYRNRTQHGELMVPRYTVKLGSEVIWDFPKDFPLKRETPHLWKEMADISALIRAYIDTPVDEIMSTVYSGERVDFVYRILDTDYSDAYEFDLGLTPLFTAGDRRLGRDRILVWARRFPLDHAVHRVIAARFP